MPSTGQIAGYLELEDGRVFPGKLFGALSGTDGEVVFNTGMVGYPESLTDPSYRGEILTLTYPLIGNYGVPAPGEDRFESPRIQARGLVVSTLTREHSHWSSVRSLDEWLSSEGIIGLEGIDTRALTKHLREKGTMLGRIVPGNERPKFNVADPNRTDLVGEVTSQEPVTFRPTGPDSGMKVLLVDCGCKASIIRALRVRGCSVTTVPYDHILDPSGFSGVLLSNGPGDPAVCKATIKNVRGLMEAGSVPIAGICLGNQLMALAAGGKTFKLPFGHRSQNQPCIDRTTGHCVITSQNHGYAVDPESLPEGWEVWYSNLNDETVEGIRHRSRPFFAVQFHPEANPGPTDPRGFFDLFMEVMVRGI
ncbi:MAG: glutamine-hydrolyzing carbamoyl-phosphate synthase small subunit [Candidatus Thermoplasmatota archaeon]|jgi:carbamoyl-phosphate synthase small subunit|nr:glutamine-hydrolyzing carbamoyl-phosphate synthase small subunit [Candidatus Thermoplasmatota archaeon]